MTARLESPTSPRPSSTPTTPRTWTPTARFFADDVVVADLNGDGHAARASTAYRARYRDAFAEFPKNKAELLNRIVLGDTVIDHERVDRGDGDDRAVRGRRHLHLHAATRSPAWISPR